MRLVTRYFLMVLLAASLIGCGDGVVLTPERYQASDQLFSQLEKNIEQADDLEAIVSIDHSRLGDNAGSAMPPAKVLIFSNIAMETALIDSNPLTALDLPLRLLAYEAAPEGDSKVIYNSFDYLRSRYQLNETKSIEKKYNDIIALALKGVSEQQQGHFTNDTMDSDGIITIASPYNFSETAARVQTAINSQDDTVGFGEVDFQARAKTQGVDIAPNLLILFGGPAPGAKAMARAPTLGLDAFCQKFLIWQDDKGQVYLSFNDLLALAERQNVSKSLPLRVINYRLKSVFEEALSAE